MFRLTNHLELPRRVAAYFVLFCTLAVVWFAVSVLLASQSRLRSSIEGRCLAQLKRASAHVALDFLRNDQANLQPLVERWQLESGLEYCAVVSRDGRYLAHSSRQLVDAVHAEHKGEYTQLGEVRRIRFADSDLRRIAEYRVSLRGGDEALGSLHMAVSEPSVWASLGSAALYLPLAVAGPLLCLVFGAAVLRRMVRPLAQIEIELNRVAVALSPAEVELRKIKAPGPAALGWNRLVDQTERDRGCSGLDRRLREAMGQLGQRQTDEILDSLPDGLAVTDGEGRIAFANRALAAITGADLDGQALGGKTMQACLELQDRAESDRPLLDPALQKRTVVAEIKRSSNGTQHIFRVARHPLRAAQGRSSQGHVWSVRDVSRQKAAEQARDQFLDMVSHELRTPLANLKAYAETLTVTEHLDVEKQKDFCNIINAEATRLARLVDDLLNISSMEVGSLSLTKEETDMERLLNEAVEKVSPQAAQKGIVLDTTFPEKWPKLQLDKDKMAAALINLLGNAVKYTAAEGRVGLRVKVTEHDCQIEVEDTGVGISAEELPKVFDKFFRSSDPLVRKEIGSGLGLSLAQEVVRMHGGALTVQSEPGKGSKFTITLPIT